MIQMLPSRKPDMLAAAVSHMHHQLGMPAHISECWGPTVRLQTDFSGQPIQQYLTLLALVSGGKYLLVRQIVDLERISRRQPVIQELDASAARWWLLDTEMAATHDVLESTPQLLAV
jgi:hypothetical protein